MRINVRGKYWTFKRVRCPDDLDGFCDWDKRRVVVSSRLTRPKDILDTTIHELLHAAIPDLAEDAVEETATCIADVLHRLGAEIEAGR